MTTGYAYTEASALLDACRAYNVKRGLEKV